jgi:KDO2-lipid IV(A) lauroyltransferase
MADKNKTQHAGKKTRAGIHRLNVNALIVKIPARHILNLGRLLGSLIFLLDVPHRRIVRRNLHFAYPHWSADHIRVISKRIFQNLAITLLEIFQMASYSCDEILEKVKPRGAEHLVRAVEQNKGLIIISAHLGNWEAGLQFLSCFLQLPITGVAKTIRFGPLHRWLNRVRTRFGLKIINKKGALPDMRAALRRGEVTGLLIDQGKRSESVDVHFFGKWVTTTPAAVLLALRCKSPVVPVFCVREANGQLTFRVEPPFVLKRTDDLRSDLITNTQMMTDAVEKMVREYPDQWLWLHKRWKKHYPRLYPEFELRRQRRKEREARRERRMAERNQVNDQS